MLPSTTLDCPLDYCSRVPFDCREAIDDPFGGPVSPVHPPSGSDVEARGERDERGEKGAVADGMPQRPMTPEPGEEVREGQPERAFEGVIFRVERRHTKYRGEMMGWEWRRDGEVGHKYRGERMSW